MVVQEIAKNLDSLGFKITKTYTTDRGSIVPKGYFVGSANINGKGGHYFRSTQKEWSKTDIKEVKMELMEYGYEVGSFSDYEREEDRSYLAMVSFFKTDINEEIDSLLGLELTV
jgi:hypothetical protein